MVSCESARPLYTIHDAASKTSFPRTRFSHTAVSLSFSFQADNVPLSSETSDTHNNLDSSRGFGEQFPSRKRIEKNLR